MLNYRLDELILKYRSYRVRELLQQLLLYTGLISILLAISYYTYILFDKPTKINKKKDLSQRVVSKTTKPIVKEVVQVVKVDESNIIYKNQLKILQMVDETKPTYQSSYDLSRYYFEQQDYKKAAKWAVVASNRSPKEDGSWLIYAKSKIKLNQVSVAKKALKIYLFKYHSDSIKELLNSL
jgi:hypothetical protein